MQAIYCMLMLLPLVTAQEPNLLEVRKLFTIHRMTSTIFETSTSTLRVYPTCTSLVSANVPPCGRTGKEFKFTVFDGQKAMLVQPLLGEDSLSRGRFDLESSMDGFEYGELIFPEGYACLDPSLRENKPTSDIVLFKTTSIFTITETVTQTVNDQTVSIIYGGCVPSDAPQTSRCIT